MQVIVKSLPYYDKEGYDTHISDEQNKLFGVFDGMGVSLGARLASGIMKKGFENYSINIDNANFDRLKYVIEALQRDVKNHTNGSGTTATVIHVDEFNAIQYAHVGDSRLYVLSDNRIKQITSDEGYGNVLYNYIGQNGKGVCQLGQIDDWDMFVLCSDGVTGDWPDQFIKDEIIENILLEDITLEQKADAIIAESKKQDDKTIIIGAK